MPTSPRAASRAAVVTGWAFRRSARRARPSSRRPHCRPHCSSSATTTRAAGAVVSSGNNASPVRVWSPGSDGSVDQSNNADSSAIAGNRAATTQNGTQSESGSGIQVLGQQAETEQDALAASLAAQFDPSNNASPVRVWSPGGGGSVTQSNNAASSAAAGNDASTRQDGRQSIAGKSCGCAQLPIQVAGQWAGTAQLAPAFSAAAAGASVERRGRHLRLEPRHRRSAGPVELGRLPRRRRERRPLGSGCEPGGVTRSDGRRGGRPAAPPPLPGKGTGITLTRQGQRTSRGEVAMSDQHPVSVHLRRLLPLIAVAGLLAPGAAHAATPTPDLPPAGAALAPDPAPHLTPARSTRQAAGSHPADRRAATARGRLEPSQRPAAAPRPAPRKHRTRAPVKHRAAPDPDRRRGSVVHRSSPGSRRDSHAAAR